MTDEAILGAAVEELRLLRPPKPWMTAGGSPGGSE